MPDQFGHAADNDSNEAKSERVCAILDVASQRFAPDSKEALAIRDATMAYRTVRENRKRKKSYYDVCAIFDDRITDEMTDELRAKLQRYGIDPDELEDDDGECDLEELEEFDANQDQPEQFLPDRCSRASDDGFHETKIGRVCAILESVANQFAPESDEALAMRDAAMAYATVRHNQELKIGYDHLCSLFEGGLTDEMKGRLQRRGIDTNELEVDDIGEWSLER
jgi:hypothetical protein